MTKRYPRKALTYDAQWAKWQKDFERIYEETVSVFSGRKLFKEVLTMFQENPHLKSAEAGLVWDWLRGMYGRDMGMAIGREMDRDARAVNLVQLMLQMERRPRVATRNRFFGANASHDPGIRRLADDWFTKQVGPGSHADPRLLKKDRVWLERRCRAVMKYRNRMVAHRSVEDLELTIAKIHESMDAIETILKKYHVIFKGSGLLRAEPIMPLRWWKPFEIAWRPPR